MTTAIDGLSPKLLWKHFAALSAIPRGSGNEAAARAYVLAQAGALGLEGAADAAGNVVVRKPARAGREGAVPAALQGHLDMVCEKNEGTIHDFKTDPIRLVRDGDWLKADGTTLGADNGVGAATLLAVMESNDVEHGPLEFVFTVDEEEGLTGASQFPERSLRAKYLFNLDNEELNTLCIGCAGGMNTAGKRRFTPRKPGSPWSTVNIRRARELKALGLMAESGLKAFEDRDEPQAAFLSQARNTAQLGEEDERTFRANPAAWEFYSRQTLSYRKTTAWWVISAKRDETRRKRLLTLIEESERHRAIPPLVKLLRLKP